MRDTLNIDAWMDMDEDELIAEFIKCREDPVYFIRHYVKVEHQLLGLVPFDLFPFQEDIIKDLTDHRFNILRKFRQAGATTIACAYAIWIAVFMKNKTIAILSIGDTEAMDILARIKLMHEELPPFLQPKLVRGGDNKHNLEFTNRCKIKSKPSKKSSGRSLASYFLIIDEGAFIEHIEDLWTSVYPIISTGGRAFVLSTVNGMGGTGKWYYDMYSGADEGENEMHPINIRWKQHPQYFYNPEFEWLYDDLKERDPKYDVTVFEKTAKRNIGLKRWKQEYLAEFLGTGDTFIDPETLEDIHSNTTADFYTKHNNRVRVWKEPQPQFEYVMGIDVSLGRERDHSAYHIFNIYNGEQVAEFYSNKTPVNEFAEIVFKEARLYNTAMVLCERNTIGTPFLENLFHLHEYDNIWMDPMKKVMGWQATKTSRETLLTEMEDFVRTKKIKIHSDRTVHELHNFIINDSNKIEAEEGQCDDLVIALALAVKAIKEQLDNNPMLASELLSTYEPIEISKGRTGWTSHPVYGDINYEDMEWVIKD